MCITILYSNYYFILFFYEIKVDKLLCCCGGSGVWELGAQGKDIYIFFKLDSVALSNGCGCLVMLSLNNICNMDIRTGHQI